MPHPPFGQVYTMATTRLRGWTSRSKNKKTKIEQFRLDQVLRKKRRESMASSLGPPRCSLAVLILCVTSVSAQLTRQKPAVPLGTQVGTIQKTSQSTGSSGTGNGAVSIGLAPRTAGNTPAPAVPLA